MNAVCQTIHMLHFIKNPKGKPVTYLGALGSNLVEILDNDPHLLKSLKSRKSQNIYIPSDKSRFRGDNQRMVLLGKNVKALFALRKTNPSKDMQRVELVILETPENMLRIMLKEVRCLAAVRWPKQALFIKHHKHKNIANLKATLSNLGWIQIEKESVMKNEF